MNELLEHALMYAARGWHVFPLKPRAKTPALPRAHDRGAPPCHGECGRDGHGLHDATTDPEKIRRWWDRFPDANIGIRTGSASGFTVVDIDPPDGEVILELLEKIHGPLPETATAITGRDGTHYLFANDQPLSGRNGGLGTNIDVKADGGYIVAPPSIHESGKPYVWLNEPDELAPLPEWIPAKLAEQRVPATAPPTRSAAALPPAGMTNYARVAFEGQVADLAAVPEGDRNGALFRAAARLGQLVAGGQIDGQTVRNGLLDACARNGLLADDGQRQCDDTITSGLMKGGQQPEYPNRPKVASPAPIVGPEGDDVVAEHNLTDLGNARRLVAAHGHRFRYVPQWKTWLYWDGRRWATDITGEIHRAAKATAESILTEAFAQPDSDVRKRYLSWALRSESDARLRAMVSQATTEPGIPVQPHELDADHMLLNVNNGTIDLTDGRLLEHEPAQLITKLAPVDYDPDAHSDLWDKFLHGACDGDQDLIDFLQQAVGYSLTGSCAEEVLFFIHGPAAAGKSTFNDAIESTLGDYARRADFETFLARKETGSSARGDIARLAGARFVNSVEVDDGKRLAEGLIKTLTGGDVITARFLFRDEFEFRPAFKLWLVANHAPKVRHGDEAMWRRILRIPFEHVIPSGQRDPAIKATLRDPQSGGPAVLAWAVAGCLAWQRSGLIVPDVIARATEAYRTGMDPLGDFLLDHCARDPEGWVSFELLRETYERWARDNGIRHPLGAQAFAQVLEEHGAMSERRRIKVDGQMVRRRVWTGLRLLDPNEIVEWDARDARDTIFQKVPREKSNLEINPETGVPPGPRVPPPEQLQDAGWTTL